VSEERKKPAYKKWWFWVGAIVVVGIIGAAGGGKKDAGATGMSSEAHSPASTGNVPEKTAEVPAEEPVMKVSAADLYSAYESNEVSANEKFRGKRLEITGEVERVDETLGSYYVHLKGAEVIGHVSCKLKDKAEAAALNAGQTVTLVGTGDGKIGFPRVMDCQIKK